MERPRKGEVSNTGTVSGRMDSRYPRTTVTFGQIKANFAGESSPFDPEIRKRRRRSKRKVEHLLGCLVIPSICAAVVVISALASSENSKEKGARDIAALVDGFYATIQESVKALEDLWEDSNSLQRRK